MYEQYLTSFWAIWLMVFTVIAQSLIATGAHRKQAQYVPGVVKGRGAGLFNRSRAGGRGIATAPIACRDSGCPGHRSR